MAVTKYLDNTGLTYFWGKIKAWCNSVFALDNSVVHKSDTESITGVKTFEQDCLVLRSTAGHTSIRASSDATALRIWGGDTSAKSAKLILVGSDFATSDAGIFALYAVDGSSSIILKGNPNGTLVWNGNDITGDVHKTGAEEISGVKTFNNSMVWKGVVNRHNDSSYIKIVGATADNKGARFILNGKDRSGYNGSFWIVAQDGTDNVTLNGQADGTLTWGGNAIQIASDERLKTSLHSVPDAVLDAWEEVNWGQFQFLNAIKQKGTNTARLHLGLIAQRVKAVFEERGLDACAYGILCHEVREATEEDGAVDMWMVRYEEALAMEAVCQRRRADRLEARIRAVEGMLK